MSTPTDLDARLVDLDRQPTVAIRLSQLDVEDAATLRTEIYWPIG